MPSNVEKSKEDEFYKKLMKFIESDWSDPDIHRKSQNNLRRLKWLKGACTDSEGNIEFQELEKCLLKMMKHWSFYWDHFMAVNNGDNTFRFVVSIVDDVFIDRKRVVEVLQSKTMYDLYGKVILAAYVSIKQGLIITREEKRAWRENKQAEEREWKMLKKQRQLEQARREDYEQEV